MTVNKIVLNTGDEPIVDKGEVDPIPPVVSGNGKVDNPDLNDDKTPEEIAVEKAALEDEGGNSNNDIDESVVEAVEIDGTEYTLNEDGSAVDAEGVVKYTKDEMDALAEADVKSTASLLAEKTNIIPIGEDGNPIEYEDTDEGLSQYISDVYEQGQKEANTSAVQGLYSKYPIVQNIVNHLELNNGNFDTFNNTISYTDVSIDNKDETQMRNIIFAARKQRGENDEKSNKYYNYLKDSDTDLKAVISEANDELVYLKGVEDQEEVAVQEALDAKAASNIEAANNYWGIDVVDGKLVDLKTENSVYSTVKSGKVKIGEEIYTIPDKIRVKVGDKVEFKTRDDFFKYIYQPIQQTIEGKKVTQTLHQTDMANETSGRTTGHDVYDAFKRYVKYDNSQFIKEQINQNKVNTITRRLTTKGDNTSSTSRAKTTGKIIIK